MTSAGDVFVCLAFSLAELPVVIFLKSCVPALTTPDISPRKYESPAPRRPCPASANKLGSFNVPWAPYTISTSQTKGTFAQKGGGDATYS